MNLRVHFGKTIDNLKLFKSIALVSILGSIFASSALLANPSTLIEQGSGSFRWFGIKVYDVRLMATPTFSGNFLYDRPMVLEFTYDIQIDKNDLVTTTLEEINNLKIGQTQQCDKKQVWATELRTIWPDLKPGDTLKYQINIDDTSDFYHNQKAIGSIADRNFSSCFVSIWLAADSSAKTLRKKLLGINAR
jgi:hypothetical protein